MPGALSRPFLWPDPQTWVRGVCGRCWGRLGSPAGDRRLGHRHGGSGLAALGGSGGQLPGHPDASTRTPDPGRGSDPTRLPPPLASPGGLPPRRLEGGQGQHRLLGEHWPRRRLPLSRPASWPGPPARLAGGSLGAPSRLLPISGPAPHSPRRHTGSHARPAASPSSSAAARARPPPLPAPCDSRGRHATSSPTAGSCPDTHTCPDLTPVDGRTGLGTYAVLPARHGATGGRGRDQRSHTRAQGAQLLRGWIPNPEAPRAHGNKPGSPEPPAASRSHPEASTLGTPQSQAPWPSLPRAADLHPGGQVGQRNHRSAHDHSEKPTSAVTRVRLVTSQELGGPRRSTRQEVKALPAVRGTWTMPPRGDHTAAQRVRAGPRHRRATMPLGSNDQRPTQQPEGRGPS